MAITLGIRGFNPIWLLDDLQGNLFDDSFYMYVLQNTIPYLPATVYHDPNLNTPWTNPIRFLGNGTLPVDVYFEQNVVYRLEFRQNDGVLTPSQADPLIYEVNNYMPGNGGVNPDESSSLATGNQITNPQFSLISFSSPFTLSGTDPLSVEVAPGWFLDLAGTGTVIISQVPLNNVNANPSNAPYALRLQLTGWNADGVILRQRFQQNGMLWANKTVSAAITAKITGAFQGITGNLVDSNGTTLTQVLNVPTVNASFVEYTGHGTLPATSNPDVPPAAYIEYKLSLPSTTDIYLTSIQLIVQDALDLTEHSFEQDSIDRQIDHTWHYYKDSVLIQPKPTILTGWNFRLNPWQFTTTSANTITASAYTADQTIVSVQNASSLQSLQTTEGYFGIQPVSAASQGKFALIQYLDNSTAAAYWNDIVSSLVKAGITTSHSTALQLKMRIIYRSDVPPAVDPISSWAATDPVFTAGWTAIAPKNDPVITISSATLTNNVFEGFQLPDKPANTAVLGIVLYTTNTLNSTVTVDKVYFDAISLVANEFAIDTQPQTFDQVLRECFFYYEKSYETGFLPGAMGNAGGCLFAEMLGVNSGGNNLVTPRSFGFPFKVIARTTNPTVQLYSPTDGTSGAVRIFLRNNGASVADGNLALSGNWTPLFLSSTGISYACTTVAPQQTNAGSNSFPEGYILYHYTKDARLGLVA
jgi:hypothetical protein